MSDHRREDLATAAALVFAGVLVVHVIIMHAVPLIVR